MRNRAGIILYCKKHKKLLLIHRFKEGREFYVVPGGGVEALESFEEAAVREIKEELNYNVNDMEFFCTIRSNSGKEQYYITFVEETTKFTICGEELLRSNENNRYLPTWITIEQLADITLYPEELRKIMIDKINLNLSLK